MSDWITNPARDDDERRRIRLTRYAVREELGSLFFVVLIVVLAFLSWQRYC